MTFRRSPFHGGYTVAAGLATAIDYLENSRFTDADAAYLATLRGNDDGPLFEAAGVAGVAFTVTVVVPANDKHPLTVTVTL